MNRVSTKWVFPILLAGCLAPPVESPPTNTVEDRRITVQQTTRNKVDILFMIDNSDSMRPKQDQLKARFPQFISQLRAFEQMGLPASYHLGVVTSDLGGCGNGEGDAGKLNAQNRADKTACPVNGTFIDYNQLDGTANVVGTVEDAFQCIASVGVSGCGFEHQLESVHRALTTDVNQGFLRDDAVLAVVFLTDEDDCSAPPDTDLFEMTKAGTNYSQAGNYGPWDSFRCTQFGIWANGAPLPWPMPGSFAEVSPAPFSEAPGQGKLFSVDRYITLFTADKSGGGVKDSPDKNLMVISIAAPPGPFATLLSNPSTEGPYVPCTSYNGTTCTMVLDRSCHASSDAKFTGDPAVRLHAVVSAAQNHEETAICADSYDQALQQLGKFIEGSLKPGCIGAPIDHPEQPDCVVSEVTNGVRVELPWCESPGATMPCWRLVDRGMDCPAVENPEDHTQQHLGLEIERSAMVSGDVHDDAECAIIAASQK